MSKERKPYWEKLKDPRWQRKRLELLESNAWRCRDCGEQTKTLEIHHRVYHRDCDPWNYEAWAYAVLCRECHKKAQALMEEAHDALAKQQDLVIACSAIGKLKDAGNVARVVMILAEGNPKLIDLLSVVFEIEAMDFMEGMDLGEQLCVGNNYISKGQANE